MSKQEITDDARRLMSPEELAMLEEEYDPEEDNAAAEAAKGQSEDDGAVGEGEGAGAGNAGEDGAGGAASAPQTQQAVIPEPEPVATASATYTVELPADYADQVDANKQARKQLREKFNDGDIDSEEFDRESERLDEERLSLVGVKQRAEISQEMRQQANQTAWVNTIEGFVKDAATNAVLGVIDYKADKAKQHDLDTFVKALANIPGNESKPMRWFLEEAHKRVVSLHGIPTSAVRTKADIVRKPAVEKVAPNLAEVMGAAGDDGIADEFSDIDKLSGLDAERALANMSADKRAQYLRRG